MDLKSKIILIYGPTASGKSIFAVQLAKRIKGEITTRLNSHIMSRHENLRDTDRTMEILGNNNKKKMRVQRRQMASEKKRVVSLTKARIA